MIVVIIIVSLVLGLAFTAFLALVYSVLTLQMGKLSPHFELTMPEDWTFRELYLRYLIVAAAFTFVALPLTPLLGCAGVIVGLFALTGAYKFAFDADLLQAVVIGGMGGGIAFVLFVFLLVSILQPLGLGELEPPPGQFEQFDEVDSESFGYDDSAQSHTPWLVETNRGRQMLAERSGSAWEGSGFRTLWQGRFEGIAELGGLNAGTLDRASISPLASEPDSHAADDGVDPGGVDIEVLVAGIDFHAPEDCADGAAEAEQLGAFEGAPVDRGGDDPGF